MKKKNQVPAEQLLEVIVNAIQDVKGEDIRSFDLRNLSHAVADFFVVCHGNSHTQAQAIARRIEEETEKILNQSVWHREGVQNAEWILLDYVDIVVHVFYRDARPFYGLEDLWADAKVQAYQYEI
jgi:ribosome-associated protein